jgi:hypothetical protein
MNITLSSGVSGKNGVSERSHIRAIQMREKGYFLN